MGYNQRRELRHVLAEIIDLMIVLISFFMAVHIFNFIFNKELVYSDIQGIIPVIIIASLFFFEIFGVFFDEESTYLENIMNIMIANSFVVIITVVVAFALNMQNFAAKIFPIALMVELILFMIYKSLWFRIRKKSMKSLNYGFLGTDEEFERIQFINQTGIRRYEVKRTEAFINGVDSIDKLVIQELLLFDGIIVGSSIDEKKRVQIIDFGLDHQKDIFFVPDFLDIVINRSRMIKINQTPLFHLNHYKMSNNMQMLKRLFDLSISIVLLILLIPLMLVISLFIKGFDRGPVFFQQERVTTKGRTFKLIKFRTMVIEAEKQTGAILAKENDKRITKLGAFLRKSRLDELPQLFNIISGSMSLVGPRPERPEFTKIYEDKIPHYNQRYTVKAGLTGLAQVLGGYSTPTEDKLKFDLMYISNYSVMLDVYILFRTVLVVFGRKGV